MSAPITDLAQLRLTTNPATPVEAVVALLESAPNLEAIQVRAATLTPVMEKILQSRPSSHWGINE
jgi:hypothetical protein